MIILNTKIHRVNQTNFLFKIFYLSGVSNAACLFLNFFRPLKFRIYDPNKSHRCRFFEHKNNTNKK